MSALEEKHAKEVAFVVKIKQDALARAVAGGLGGKVGVAPRLFLKKLVSDVLDRVDLHEDFDPRKHYTLTLAETEMSATERAAASAASVDDIEL